MTDHPIRLRGGWERLLPEGDGKPERVTLPLGRWPEEWGPTRLVRRFQTPSYSARDQSLWLRLDALPGLVSLSLNGRALGVSPFPEGPMMLPIGTACEARNVLALNVEPTRIAVGSAGSTWGIIALVVRFHENTRPSTNEGAATGEEPLGGTGLEL